MSVTDAGISQMTFGVDAATPIGTTVYTEVLSGIAGGNLTTTSGTWGGGLFNNTWALTEASASVWDLSLTSEAIVPSVEGESGNSLANAIIRQTTEFASGNVPPGTIMPVLENGVTLQQAAQTMTAEQASQLSDVHAEGYSSNLTIGLQQIAMISEAVTDRIGDQEEPSRRIWVDASAIRGTVDGYDGLSGFDYNLFHVILGGDVVSSSTGNFGVYAGLGQSSMTESEYVPQDFSTTSLFAGLYGGRELGSGMRLAASAGYIHGANEATRHNADIGQFTGGTATSDYATDGVHGTVKLSKAIDVSDGLTLSPFAGAALAQLWAQEAAETGGGDFNYTISDASAYTTVVFVGSGVRAPVSGTMAVVGFARLG
jgi:outer membrane autotransporter protein